MSRAATHQKPQADEQGTMAKYTLGFIGSIVLTVVAFLLTENYRTAAHALLGHRTIIPVIAGLALVQCITQLTLFLHLGSEARPRWRLLVFALMLAVVGILVVGSLWIMSNLNYRMTPQQVNTYMHNQDGL